jgi:hypothetical protein
MIRGLLSYSRQELPVRFYPTTVRIPVVVLEGGTRHGKVDGNSINATANYWDNGV